MRSPQWRRAEVMAVFNARGREEKGDVMFHVCFGFTWWKFSIPEEEKKWCDVSRLFWLHMVAVFNARGRKKLMNVSRLFGFTWWQFSMLEEEKNWCGVSRLFWLHSKTFIFHWFWSTEDWQSYPPFTPAANFTAELWNHFCNCEHTFCEDCESFSFCGPISFCNQQNRKKNV